ncbi:hypothetical protein DEAC_c10740 [Desulfosporosinus acididurans]|uniref:Uncharacterized protein n=1 Tax=Desulfosporosinus acididurans TaxID=476652 RepID=A0A0J1FUL7_9FIRM|nr:hypothetical protein DEAC_c10740 [Desulfosporosinus acididurans]
MDLPYFKKLVITTIKKLYTNLYTFVDNLVKIRTVDNINYDLQ